MDVSGCCCWYSRIVAELVSCESSLAWIFISHSCGDESLVLGAVKYGGEGYPSTIIPSSRFDSLVDICCGLHWIPFLQSDNGIINSEWVQRH